jgi:hypothetical protein
VGTEGGKTRRTSRTKTTERGVIRRSQEAWCLPERRGKGSEERRREIRCEGVRVTIWDWRPERDLCPPDGRHV